MCSSIFARWKKALAKACENVRQLHSRNLPTSLHQKAWISYEKILMYRTNVSFFMRFVNDLILYALGDTLQQKAAKYIADGKPINEEFVDSTTDTFTRLLQLQLVGRALLLLISFKYLKVTKVMCYYTLLVELIIEVGVPIDAGDLRQAFLSVRLLIFFILDYFHFYPTVICVMVVQLS